MVKRFLVCLVCSVSDSLTVVQKIVSTLLILNLLVPKKFVLLRVQGLSSSSNVVRILPCFVSLIVPLLVVLSPISSKILIIDPVLAQP